MTANQKEKTYKDKAPPAPSTTATAIDIANLATCVEDSRLSVLDSDAGPEDPVIYHELLGRLAASSVRLPPLYRESLLDPYQDVLVQVGPNGFASILIQDPKRVRLAGLMLDLAHAVLQNGERFLDRETDAFQEVVSDLYDGFLSAEDRRGVKNPDHMVIPPLVKWGNPENGPYTWPIDATQTFGCETAIVSLPPAHSRKGLMAWAALGHETAGHDILHADEGLQAELASKVRDELNDAGMPFLAHYWSQRIDETASDVLGILNMGPAAAIGLIGYFRGIRAAVSGTPHLSNLGRAEGVHPADILRGFLGAAVVRHLSFQGADDWADVIQGETEKDVSNILLGGVPVSQGEAEKSAEIVARAIATEPVVALENTSLIEIQDWRDEDEAIVQELGELISQPGELSDVLSSGTYAAHVVAAAVTGALKQGRDVALAHSRMVGLLKTMHDANPSWGPMFVASPSAINRHLVYS